MFERRLPIQSLTTATAQYFGSVAGGNVLAGTSTTRANLQIQGLTGALRISPVGSVTASSMLIASQAIYSPPDGFTGPLFGNPDGGSGATAPIFVWDSSF